MKDQDIENIRIGLAPSPDCVVQGEAIGLKPNGSSLNNSGEEIDLWTLWHVFWGGRYLVLISGLLITAFAILVAFLSPNIYTSEVILARASNDTHGGLPGLGAQIGGLASLAGINLQDNNSNKLAQASAVIVSWPFLEAFVDEEGIKPDVVAANGWDPVSDVVKYKSTMFDADSGVWVSDGVNSEEPSSWETYEALRRWISVRTDKRTGLFYISVDHYSPTVAKKIAQKLARKINLHYQKQDALLAANSVAFLERMAAQTSVSEFKNVFYSMIEQQTKTLMLAEASEEYLLRTVVPASVPEIKSAPKRKMITFLGGISGLMLGMLLVLSRHIYRSRCQKILLKD